MYHDNKLREKADLARRLAGRLVTCWEARKAGRLARLVTWKFSRQVYIFNQNYTVKR